VFALQSPGRTTWMTALYMDSSSLANSFLNQSSDANVCLAFNLRN